MKFARTLLSALLLSAIATASDAATGFEYISDAATLGLWHFNEGQGNGVQDASKNQIKSAIEGTAKWDTNEEWNGLSNKGHSFVFDGATQIVIPKDEKAVQPKEAITVEAWVYPEALDGWKLICAHWGGAVVGSYHLGVEAGIPKFHINTDAGTSFAAASKPLELNTWQHVAGTYDGKTIVLYIDGKESGTAKAQGKLVSGDPNFAVVIGSKDSREFAWKGLMDEVRISSVARDAAELSPNFDGPQAVEFRLDALPMTWSAIKRNY